MYKPCLVVRSFLRHICLFIGPKRVVSNSWTSLWWIQGNFQPDLVGDDWAWWIYVKSSTQQWSSVVSYENHSTFMLRKASAVCVWRQILQSPIQLPEEKQIWDALIIPIFCSSEIHLKLLFPLHSGCSLPKSQCFPLSSIRGEWLIESCH